MNNITIEQRLKELECLNNLSQSIIAKMDVDNVLQKAIDAATSLCHAKRASVLLFDPNTKETVKTLIHKPDTESFNIGHLENSLIAAWILKYKMPFRAEKFKDAIDIPDLPQRFDKYGAVLGVPIAFSGEIIGVINLMNDQEEPCFSDNDLHLANTIANSSAQFINNAKLQEKLFYENQRLREELRIQNDVSGIVYKCQAMKEVLEKISIVTNKESTVLVAGETGTGKELVARAIHFQSDRADKPFVPVNCAAIAPSLVESELFGHEKGAFTGAISQVKGKFELAHGGTLFLDEISEMPIDIQPKLLRVLENRKYFRVGSASEISVNVRVIAASSKDLRIAVSEGKFREDLYYRLNVFPIAIPPLRDRKEDIPVLAQKFLDEFSSKTKKFTDSALEKLQGFEWKGNVRELRNIVERISLMIHSEEITPEDLARIGNDQNLMGSSHQLLPTLTTFVQYNEGKKDILEEIEKIVVQIAIQKSKNNSSEAAKILGIDRMALDRRRKKYNL